MRTQQQALNRWDLVLIVLLGAPLLVAAVADYARAQTLSAPVGLVTNIPCGGTGLSLATHAQVYLNGTTLDGLQPCGQQATYANAITVAGTYTVTYKWANAAGLSAASSPGTTVQVLEAQVPPNPTEAPPVMIICTPEPCPPWILVTKSAP